MVGIEYIEFETDMTHEKEEDKRVYVCKSNWPSIGTSAAAKSLTPLECSKVFYFSINHTKVSSLKFSVSNQIMKGKKH